ncbi:DUF3710 domain-containing protein [Tessaracoccus sp. OH4464_COT-324]|uniref:DUF3710 domain-containing protein n=1 Tax=Tessaracoccus sp. OH4464_COT-324 TaxID=2491059 RepID=UPI000F62C211|nr:DUF3710 domain-containing protein [Tessaracoccus sp. OH4464_COT-324]RRD47399.1 DUF3710 domain-containing protein [Tessaracoccus sp. OH4464_COT-324]
MIFGRRKRVTEEPKAEELESFEEESAAEEQPESSEAERALAEARQEWARWDEEFDRENGPFDIEEVDLGADDVTRVDLGTLVVTPFEGMKMQISVNQQQVPQAVIVATEDSGMEISLFGAPSRSSYLAEVRNEIIAATQNQPGTKLSVRKGPFGTELLRAMPLRTEDGRDVVQVTRTWMAEGPAWIVRGVVFGKAAMEPDNEDIALTLLECFANLVVRRGSRPVAAGSVIPLTLPDLPEAAAKS